MIGHYVLGVLGVLALVCVGSLFTSSRSRSSWGGGEQKVRRVERMGGTAGRAVLGAIQWAVLANTGDPIVWAAALGVPALFAGASLARLTAVTDIVHTSRGDHR